jgi:hypothetical protein
MVSNLMALYFDYNMSHGLRINQIKQKIIE